jgi:hypothetical protein
MNPGTTERALTEQGVQEELQRQPHILMKLAENALKVAESLRNNYFSNTASFISKIRRIMRATAEGKHDPLLTVHKVNDISWGEQKGEVVTFIDGGVGQTNVSNQTPILLRVGSYCVRTGERNITEREQFGYYPVIFGDLEGGSKDRKDFTDIVRITAELLGGLAALDRASDMRVLMFHGPLVYLMNLYAGHSPFTEHDINLFLQHYALNSEQGRQLKEEFLHLADRYVYMAMTDRSDDWVNKRLFEPLSWIAFLYQKLIKIAQKRDPKPIIMGAVERGELSEFSKKVLLTRIFQNMRARENRANFFNETFGRTDLNTPDAVLKKLGYTDALLLAMLLQPGERSEEWTIEKYERLPKTQVTLSDESFSTLVDFRPLKPNQNLGFSFPQVRGCYISVSETTEPIRIETFSDLGDEQIIEAARRVYLYSKLLPGYGFPIGLDIADKYAHIPNWLTDAYSKIIKLQLGISLQRGEISDAEMRRILVQAIYMTHRDWLFRPRN